MKTKIVIGSILAVCILMMIPSISAIEFNTAIEVHKQSFLKQNINELKQLLAEPYIDIEMILIVILSILTMTLLGKPSIYLTLVASVYSFAIVLGVVSGIPVIKCEKIHSMFVLSITYFLVVLENAVISNKVVSKAICTITFLIGYIIALMLAFSPPVS